MAATRNIIKTEDHWRSEIISIQVECDLII